MRLASYCCEAGFDGGCCDGELHAPNDKAKTARSKAKKRRMNTSSVFIGERTLSGALDQTYTGHIKPGQRDAKVLPVIPPPNRKGRNCSRIAMVLQPGAIFWGSSWWTGTVCSGTTSQIVKTLQAMKSRQIIDPASYLFRVTSPFQLRSATAMHR